MKPNSKVKTVFVFNWWLNSNGGGVKKHNIELVNSLQRDYGLMCHVMYRNGDDENSTKLHRNFFSRIFQIISFLSISKPRSVVIEGGIILAFSCLLYKYLVNKKCYLIYTLHTYPQDTYKMKKYVLGLILKKYNYIIYISNNLQNIHSKLYGYNFGAKERIIKPCIFNQKETVEKNFEEHKFDILVVGLLSNKTSILGSKLVIDSLPKILELYPRTKIIFTSNGRYKSVIQKYVSSKGLDTNVSFVGFVKDLDKLYSECDVFLYTTYGTGMPLSIIEAMSKKCAIMASKVGGIPEIFEDNKEGFCFENSIEDLTNTLIKFLKDSNLRLNFGNNAYTRFENEFDSIHLSRNYYNLIVS
tara:strand:- start:6326 stop:7396 length:1071 start_codon:yes stop_codon:yes gene_type:complete